MNIALRPWLLVMAVALATIGAAGCATSQDPTLDRDRDTDHEIPDADVGVEPDADPGEDADVGVAPDADPGDDADVGDEPDVPVIEEGESWRTPDAEVLRVGRRGRFLLRGTVLAPNEVIDPGEVLFVDGEIRCVAADCTTHTDAADASWIDTHGIISPGLIDGHNHLGYNFLPQWFPSPYRLFNNRYQWADDEAYEWHVRPYAKRRSTGTHYCPAAKWGELRSVIHATTTVQGQSFQQSCVNWGVRNADHYHGLGYSHMRTSIASVRDITDAQAQNYLDSFNAETNPTTRFAVHMVEGIADNNVLLEFDSFAGRDTRNNRHQGVSLLHNGTSILIHSMVLTDEQIAETYYSDSKIVWSPSSNIVLYGVTADIEKILEAGITTGIGPDWTVSGEPDMLAELRFARDYARSHDIGILTSKKLWEMATRDGALVVGLERHIGRLAEGYRADIAVFGRTGPDPYDALIDSRTEDVRLSFVDGQAFYGDVNLRETVGRNEFCEPFEACGREKFICVQDEPAAPNRRNEKLGDIRTQLYNILEGIGYPEDEQYGRGDELLELALCDD